MNRLILAAIAATTLLIAGCGSSDNDGAADKAAATSTPTVASTPAETTPADSGVEGCKNVAAPKPRQTKLAKPTTTLSAGEAHIVTLTTSCGTIKIKLDVKNDPKTASSFAHLVKSGFFDGLSFHRVVPNFVIQGGDPAGTGEGGPGYSVVEAPPSDQTYTKGVVAMAKTGAEAAGTSGSQFFIVTGADAGLPPDYAVAGTVSSGQDVADRIGSIQPSNGQDGPPSQTVVIEKATLGSK